MFQNKSPNIESFTRLKEYQPQIDQAGYCTALEESLAAVIAPLKDSVIAIAVSKQKNFQSRDDYRELLELTIIFFGGIPPRGIHFQYPGAVHRARWMARVKCFETSTIFESSRKCPEEDHQPLMGKQFEIIWSKLV